MHRSHGLQGSLKRRYKHPSPTSINGYHTAKKLLSQSPAKRPTFAFADESGYTLAFANRIAHSGLHAETGAFRTGPLSLPSERSARSQTSPGRVSERQTLPLLGLGRVYARRTQKACGTAMRLCVSLSRRRRGLAGLRDLFRFCRNRDLYIRRSWFSACARHGWYNYPRTVSHVSETLRDRVSERRTLPLWDLGREVLSKNAESLRDSDALMRVAVPRRRGPAGLRDLFRFCRNCGLYALRSGPFRVCEARGGITTLSALYVLLKRRTAACQNGSFAVF